MPPSFAQAPAPTRVRAAALALIATVLALGGALTVLDHRVGRRLGSGLAHAHARFFSSPLRIVSGMDVERAGLAEHLARRGYRRDDALAAPGTWRREGGAILIRLRAFADPAVRLPERLARIELDGARVRAIVDVPSGRVHRQATLESADLGVVWDGAWSRRHPVRLAALPAHVSHAVLAAEDVRFYRHGGIDLRGVLRALWVNVRERRVAEGASTITQQLARSFFLTPARTWRRKALEALIAVVLERRMAKDEILELYLNEVYLGRAGAVNVIGIGEAARTFFDKPAEELTVGEAATIAGIIPAPNSHSPLRHPERARRRRDAVLGRMVAAGFLGAEAAAAAARAPLAVAGDDRAPVDGLYLLEQARREVETRLGADALRDRRLDVYTTLDPSIQRHAERGVAQALAALEGRHRWLSGGTMELEGAFVVLDTGDGAVRALVGGRDFARHPFDRALTARRQAGSTFKPFVYLAAFATRPHRLTPSTLLDDSPLSLRLGPAGKIWRPVNYDRRFRGPVTARTALESSLNVPTVRLAQHVGIEAVARAAAAAGWPGDLPRVPALALGAVETSLVDLAAAYTLFPALGAPVAPHLLRGVAAADGTVLYRREPPAPRLTVDPRAAYLVHHLLEGAVDRGTARALRRHGFTGPLAGKTGTTNDYRDAWFVGYTPDLVGAAWVGFDDGRPLRLSGATSALEVWTAAMRPVLAAEPRRRFEIPEGIVFRDVDPASGLRSSFACPHAIPGAFVAGTEPTEPCGRRLDLREARGSIEEPSQVPARAVPGWVRDVMRALGLPGGRELRERAGEERRRWEEPRRRYPAELEEEWR